MTSVIFPQLDLSLALEHKQRGVRKAAARNATYIETMRGIARLVGQHQAVFCADDLRLEAARRGIEPTHYNAIGALFASPQWKEEFEFVGYTKSKQVQGHGNLIRTWRLRAAHHNNDSSRG